MSGIVARSVNGITINDGIEFLTNSEDKIINFASKEAARRYLRRHGYTDEDMEFCYWLPEGDPERKEFLVNLPVQ